MSPAPAVRAGGARHDEGHTTRGAARSRPTPPDLRHTSTARQCGSCCLIVMPACVGGYLVHLQSPPRPRARVWHTSCSQLRFTFDSLAISLRAYVRIILDSVDELGQRWRLVAGRLFGRSDDAVRNRWKR